MLEYDFSPNTKEYAFLDEFFELYAPIWIPMPKEYHYQYWKSFVKIQDYVDEYIRMNRENYKNIREYFISELSNNILNLNTNKILE